MIKLLWLKEKYPPLRDPAEALMFVPSNYDEEYVLEQASSDLGWVEPTIRGEAQLENMGTLADIALYRAFKD